MVIGGLKPDTTYSITVAAYTTKGDGARSKPKLVVTKGAGQCDGLASLFISCNKTQLVAQNVGVFRAFAIFAAEELRIGRRCELF